MKDKPAHAGRWCQLTKREKPAHIEPKDPSLGGWTKNENPTNLTIPKFSTF